MQQADGLKIGIVVDLQTPPQGALDWARCCLNRSGVGSTTVLVAGEGTSPAGSGPLADRFAGMSYAALMRLDAFAARQRPGTWESWRRWTVGQIVGRLAQSLPSGCTVVDFAGGPPCPASDFDVVFNLADETAADSLVQASRLGVVDVVYADDREVASGAVGFWEVRRGLGSSGITLRHRASTQPGSRVVFRANVTTRGSAWLNRQSLLRAGQASLTRVLDYLLAEGGLPAGETSAPARPKRVGPPPLDDQLRYAAGRIAGRARSLVSRRLLGRENLWSVAFAPSHWTELDMGGATVIPNRAGHYNADPFLIEEGGDTYCFVEDFDLSSRRGAIGVYKLAPGRADWLGRAIDEPFHMSFPFLFRHGSRLYMCPETSAARDIRVYECVEFPLGWRLAHVLMRDVHAVDTMLLQKGEEWWMLTGIDSLHTGDDCCELHVFVADDPTSAAWTPIPANPVIVDSNRARNAGLLFAGGEFYRVGQRQGLNAYGAGIAVNRIVQMDCETYREERRLWIGPDFMPGVLGTHHLHGTSRYTAFDLCRLARPS